jgi:HEAT repeat protein
MFLNPEEQAIALLNDKKLSYDKRQFAIHYLAERPTPIAIKGLVSALRDSEFAVRWTAATALAQLGILALPDVLRALMNPIRNTARLREGVLHILHYSSTIAHEPVYKHG